MNLHTILTRHAELVSASIAQRARRFNGASGGTASLSQRASAFCETWTLKQVQGDGKGWGGHRAAIAPLRDFISREAAKARRRRGIAQRRRGAEVLRPAEGLFPHSSHEKESGFAAGATHPAPLRLCATNPFLLRVFAASRETHFCTTAESQA